MTVSTDSTGRENDTGQIEEEALEEAVEAEETGTPEDDNGQEPENAPVSRDEELESALQEAGEARADMLRMQADMENLRKRLVREHEKSRRRALERFMGDLLPVVDSLERGLEAAEDPAATVEALKEGKELIRKMLAKAMGDHGLVVIDPVGEPFDPEVHEAMTMLPSEEFEENVVMEVLQKGYRLHERLIRPAKVVVSRGQQG
jgi:molecular chaperone GrpE